MGIYTEVIALILSGLYGARDFFLLNVPLIGDIIAWAIQWIINVIPL